MLSNVFLFIHISFIEQESSFSINILMDIVMPTKQRIKLRLKNIFIRKMQKKNIDAAMMKLTKTFMRYGQRRIGFIPEEKTCPL